MTASPEARAFWRAYLTPCRNPIEVTRLDPIEAELLCGCGACPPLEPPRPRSAPPRCCGHTGHRPEPGIGCTTPACLCLEPADIHAEQSAGTVWLGAY